MPCLEITTMVGCPQRCTYCPQDALKSQYGNAAKYLELEDLKRVLAKVPRYVRIDFSGMSEPWANPAATDMLAHALAEGFNVSIYTTLCGMKDPARVVDLLKAHVPQVEAVVLHLPDRNGNMRGFRMTPAYREALDAFMALRELNVLRWLDIMTMDRESEPHPDLMHLVPPPSKWEGHERAGALDTQLVGDQPVIRARHAAPVSCSFTPFYDQNVLLPNGDVVLCCMDYSLKHKLGNLLTDDYLDLFKSKVMSDLRAENMQRGPSDKTICKNCHRAKCHVLKEGSNQFWEEEKDPVEGEAVIATFQDGSRAHARYLGNGEWESPDQTRSLAQGLTSRFIEPPVAWEAI